MTAVQCYHTNLLCEIITFHSHPLFQCNYYIHVKIILISRTKYLITSNQLIKTSTISNVATTELLKLIVNY